MIQVIVWSLLFVAPGMKPETFARYDSVQACAAVMVAAVKQNPALADYIECRPSLETKV